MDTNEQFLYFKREIESLNKRANLQSETLSSLRLQVRGLNDKVRELHNLDEMNKEVSDLRATLYKLKMKIRDIVDTMRGIDLEED